MRDYTYEIAMTMLPGLRSTSARRLLEVVDTPAALFGLPKKELCSLFGKHTGLVDAIAGKTTVARAEKEMAFCEQHHIRPLFMTDPEYPQRLNRAECTDSPVLLYALGTADLNSDRALSMVGTRSSTDYGRELARKLVEGLAGEGVTIVSGLALGIDAASHEAALAYGLPTVAVLAHGLDTIYPYQNRRLAQRIVDNGGTLLTEMPTGTKIFPGLFPVRNRIIAALGDATVVVEASTKGGALITANIANSYHRDLFAFPGRVDDKQSAGCNAIIATCKATLIRDTKDLLFDMGWECRTQHEGKQTELFADLAGDEKTVHDLLVEHPGLSIEEIRDLCDLPLPKIATALLALELKNLCRCLPGKVYKPM